MDLFNTETLIGVVQGLKRPQMGILDRYFKTVSTAETEHIDFDVVVEKRRVAPFVSPLVAGKIVDSQGQKVQTFTPAYVKDKRRFNPQRALKRAIGEAIGGTLSPGERMQAILAMDIQDQVDMLHRRFELMAVEALRTGKVTVVGDDYPSKVVDFLRPAACKPADLVGTARWGQSAAVPLDDLQDAADVSVQQSGAQPYDIILGTDAWKAFRKDPEVKARLAAYNTRGLSLEQSAQEGEGLNFKGVIDGFNIFTYNAWYVDPADGVEKRAFPANEMLAISDAVEGVRAFGAILDHEALRSMEYFPKSWLEQDPSIRFLLLQSAPLMVPARPAASISRVVL
jgi:hypothetical protein